MINEVSRFSKQASQTLVNLWNLHNGKINSRSCLNLHTHAMTQEHKNNINVKISLFHKYFYNMSNDTIVSFFWLFMHLSQGLSMYPPRYTWSSLCKPGLELRRLCLPLLPGIKVCAPPCQATIISLGNKFQEGRSQGKVTWTWKKYNDKHIKIS